MNTLAQYLSDVRKIRSLGSVPETPYYPPLSELLNTIGKGLSPKVRCVVHPKSQGAGIPDLALFSADQLPSDGEPLAGAVPSRGVIEAKGTGESVDKIAASKQVAKYLERYGQVLVTNLREFLLVTREGAKERFVLAESEAAFWNTVDDSAHDAFVGFLKRVLLSDSPLREPKDVAWLLASYAREARARMLSSDLDALKQLRAALEEALGITFTGEKGDHFFRSTLVQTLFYGVFSAWVLWSQRHQKGRFDWRAASYELRVPMIKALFYQAADPSRLEPLGLVEVLDWAGDALNRVDREAFFTRFAAENAVQYFYEPFLEAFDPELRKDLGVWYTPREIVRYQVARVDKALREDLNIAAGLADPNVVVLDPCCGTGAYLVEVLKLIHERLTDGGADMLALADVKKAAIERVFGFEILPAPFVVAHLQLGLMLETMGVSLSAATN
ncbi:MAG: adenine specific methyltransferase [Chthonomonadaceae bacterium]|nr:adenine specific methyltransferase [Chthonomonadaceae bacterium]